MTRLGELTWPEVAARPGILLVPLGSTEQHGPHLPLDTDTRIAVGVAERVAARLVVDDSAASAASVAPPLAIGASGEHAGFAGTLSIGATVFEEAVVELARSADAFDGVVWVNAHGGNGAALARAHARLEAEGRRSLVLACSVPGADAHAGRTETSLMLALAPHLVRLDRAAAGDVRRWREIADEVVEHGVASVSPNGVLGDPAGASAAEGEELLGDLVDRLAAAVARWARAAH
ncbi:MAG: mycofactocin biosynthesis peptidyl-dipeptidase MftE [Acidimicrobiales bacterium]